MANHVLATSILLRYDSYMNWMNSEVILKAGEMAVAYFSNRSSIANTNIMPENTPPAVGLKIGDGSSYFYELPWVQAIAADVYNWAKTSTKPVYTAQEIQNLDTYIKQYIEDGGGGGGSGGGTSQGYRIIYNAAENKYILQVYDDATSEWTNTTSEIDLSTLISRLTALENWANGSTTDIGSIELPLIMIVRDEISNQLTRLSYNDQAVENQFITEVKQNNGKIQVSRAAVNASGIKSGILASTYGGTGISSYAPNQLLAANNNGVLSTRAIISNINIADNIEIPNVGAIKGYVTEQTAGLTGAMHFIGEAEVTVLPGSATDPKIDGYNIRQAKSGDVIFANDKQELVWTGHNWRLLGDEGSYAVKGSITNADIDDEANISLSKIDGLTALLNNKVDKIEGKQLSTNDFTNEEKSKLTNIENNAQQNLIEHIYLNDKELIPINFNGTPKSIIFNLLEFTAEDAAKLASIETGAQVNTIEAILVNGVQQQILNDDKINKYVNIEFNPFTPELQDKLENIEENAEKNKIQFISVNGAVITPNENRIVNIIIDPHSEHENKIEQIFVNGIEQIPNNDKQVKIIINTLEGARYLVGANTYADISITNNKLDLSHIAATGDVQHLLQAPDTYIILNCGSSTTVI